MLLLPSHQDRHYEPLFKPESTLSSRLNQWRYKVPLILLAVLAALQVLHLSYTSHTSEHYISEEEWVLPTGLEVGESDPLWTSSRMEPFFHEVEGNNHRELGYGNGQVHLEDAPHVRRSLYRHLLQSFHSFSQEHSFHFWLAHGSLLGQRWGQKIMTMDSDVDVQCTISALHKVQQYEKQLWEDRFMLIVNPHYLIRNSRNRNTHEYDIGLEKNVIDARWMDVMTGYFIDVTALSASPADPPPIDVSPLAKKKEGKLVQDKTPHLFAVDELNPQQKCRFEGMDLWCPVRAEKILMDEYNGYDDPHFKTWRFNQSIQAFSEIGCSDLVDIYRSPNAQNCDRDCKTVVKNQRELEYSERDMECFLKVSWLDKVKNKTITREYVGRKVPDDNVDIEREKPSSFPPVNI